jgi:hypothetical protein
MTFLRSTPSRHHGPASSAGGLATLAGTAVLVASGTSCSKRLGSMILTIAHMVDLGSDTDTHRALNAALSSVAF